MHKSKAKAKQCTEVNGFDDCVECIAWNNVHVRKNLTLHWLIREESTLDTTLSSDIEWRTSSEINDELMQHKVFVTKWPPDFTLTTNLWLPHYLLSSFCPAKYTVTYITKNAITLITLPKN